MRLRITTAPAPSTPCTWNTDFAIPRPIVLTSPMNGSPQCGLLPQNHPMALLMPQSGRRPQHQKRTLRYLFDHLVDVLESVSLWQCIFVDLAVFHDDLEVLGGIGDQVDIVQWISVNKQQIRECALFHDAKLSWIRATLASQRQQFGVGPSRHGERFGRGVPTDKRGQNCPLALR